MPRRVSSRAAVSPAMPAPMMQTSQLSSLFNSDLAARGSEVWEYQVLGKDMVNPWVIALPMWERACVARGFIPVRLRSSRRCALTLKCRGRSAAQRG
ncbi:hypothetical protein EMIT0P100_20190 [Pseudomonas sp. IT-P100]